MTYEQDLFGMTFDQQLHATEGRIEDLDISPNRCIPGEIVFEPMGAGVRVTARDSEHRILWGYVGSKETVRQIHCLVATYDTLQNLIGEELGKRGLFVSERQDPIEAAQRSLDSLEKTLKSLRDSLKVKKVSDATLERARTIERIVSDADRQISLEVSTLKGMKS
jgi:hypothetical protein